MKRRTLLRYLPFGTLGLMDIAAAAPKVIAPNRSQSVGLTAVAAPYISARQLVLGVLNQHLLPSASALLQAVQALVASLAEPNATKLKWRQHRALWINTMLAWERLAAVSVGPLLERRSARTIDFWPTRPAQIERLLANGLGGITSVQQLDTVGVSARGLPTLEWLLWKTDGSDHAHTYAHLLAQQVAAESEAMLSGYQTLATTEWDEADAWALYGEWFGQAVGGLDQLRIKKMVPDTRAKNSSPWVRGLSGQTAAAWWAQAQGLQAFLVGSPAGQATTMPGLPVAGSVNSLLLGRGYMGDSQALLRQTQATLVFVQAARPANAASVRKAQVALAQLSSQMSALAGGVLNIALGFTDADGD